MLWIANMKYVPLREAVATLGLHPNTLRKYADAGKIEAIKTHSGQRRFNVESYLNATTKSHVILYCRVSSRKQRDDLERQTQRLQDLYPQAEIIKDVGSGLNFKRKGLRSILERCLRGEKLSVVVSHRDRLARFGFDLIAFLVQWNGGEIVVLDRELAGSPEAELTSDLLAILHHFSCRMHGQRSRKSQANSDLSNSDAKGNLQEMVRCLEVHLQRDCESPELAKGRARRSLDGHRKDYPEKSS